MQNPVHELYGNKTRVRACGICIAGSAILLVNHRHISSGSFWAPPGGGLALGEDAHACLVREFKEETNLTVEAGELLFVCEVIRPPLHAIELFFSVRVVGGQLRTGTDPESGENQIIEEARFVAQSELDQWPREQLHGLFARAPKIAEITGLRGYFKL
jgi:8-oxo-dGTP diphosphatase